MRTEVQSYLQECYFGYMHNGSCATSPLKHTFMVLKSCELVDTEVSEFDTTENLAVNAIEVT